MKPNLKNQIALVTGASKGIGKAIAIGLASEGCHLALVARNEKNLKTTAQKCKEVSPNCRTLCLPYDLSKMEGIESLVQKTISELGGLNILINNAGKSNRAYTQKAHLDKWDEVLDLNLRSMIHLTRFALPQMLQGEWGGIINIASVSGKLTSKTHAIYTATKHGVMGFTGSLYEDVRESNIKVCAICPGYVDTPLVDKINLIKERMIRPEDIADTVNFVLKMNDTACPVEILIRPQRTPYPKN